MQSFIQPNCIELMVWLSTVATGHGGHHECTSVTARPHWASQRLAACVRCQHECKQASKMQKQHYHLYSSLRIRRSISGILCLLDLDDEDTWDCRVHAILAQCCTCVAFLPYASLFQIANLSLLSVSFVYL